MERALGLATRGTARASVCPSAGLLQVHCAGVGHMDAGSMQENYRDALTEAIQRTLAHRAGTSPNANETAAATVGTLAQVAVHVAPVIGQGGVALLFSRALHLASTRFEWLVPEREYRVGVVPLSALQTRLAACEAQVATEASVTLLLTFSELLSSLVGKALAERLLALVWSPARAAT